MFESSTLTLFRSKVGGFPFPLSVDFRRGGTRRHNSFFHGFISGMEKHDSGHSGVPLQFFLLATKLEG